MNTNDLLLTVAVELEANARREEREQPADGDGPSALREWARQLRALAARCDQPAGEPVPLPEFQHFTFRADGVHLHYSDGSGSRPETLRDAVHITQPNVKCEWTPLYTADQLRTHREEYAETVAAPLREQARCWQGVAEGEVELRQLANEEIADLKRERDEARRDAERYRWLRKFSANSAPMPATIPVLLWAGRYHDSWLHKLDAAIDSAMGDDNGK